MTPLRGGGQGRVAALCETLRPACGQNILWLSAVGGGWGAGRARLRRARRLRAGGGAEKHTRRHWHWSCSGSGDCASIRFYHDHNYDTHFTSHHHMFMSLHVTSTCRLACRCMHEHELILIGMSMRYEIVHLNVSARARYTFAFAGKLTADLLAFLLASANYFTLFHPSGEGLTRLLFCARHKAAPARMPPAAPPVAAPACCYMCFACVARMLHGRGRAGRTPAPLSPARPMAADAPPMRMLHSSMRMSDGEAPQPIAAVR